MSEKNLKMKLHCPMPELDFDIITLGHGSGGLLTNKLLQAFFIFLTMNIYNNDMMEQY
jgi:hydrogenase expression/formation protein HypE